MEEKEIRNLLERIYQTYFYDFRSYSKASLRRRLQFIMSKYNLKHLSDLDAKIFSSPESFQEVLSHFFVPTTEMFRNPDQFLAFRNEIIPMLKTYPSLKIWIAGCSTGQEVYSYAIALHEEGLLGKSLIYATDISSNSLEAAKLGAYPINKLKLYSKNYVLAGGKYTLSSYFEIHHDMGYFSNFLKENVVFSDHSLATDNVFAEVQLVSCRNVLIYFERNLQDRALELFRDSLCHRGYLALGDKESLRFSTLKDKFVELPLRCSLYQKLG